MSVLDLPFDDELARRIRASEFTKRIETFAAAGSIKHIPLHETVRFRERGEQLNVLEAFLRSPRGWQSSSVVRASVRRLWLAIC
jgi:hypothetical protein